MLPNRSPNTVAAHGEGIRILWRRGPSIRIPYAAIEQALGVGRDRLSDRLAERYVENHLDRLMDLAEERFRAGELSPIVLEKI